MKRNYETMSIFLSGFHSQESQRKQLSIMLDDLFTWLECDGVIVIHW